MGTPPPSDPDAPRSSSAGGVSAGEEKAKVHRPYIGFMAGICSGWTKLVVGHPFDTIKIVQCAPRGTYQGAWQCFVSTVSKEGPRALYKGASVPAVSWGITDSILMGSLHNYRAFLKRHGFSEPDPQSPLLPSGELASPTRLTLSGHALAGLFAGWTNATVAHPTETIKCKLQLQMVQPEHVPKEFRGPVDVVRKTIQAQGVQGMFKGLGASFMYRSSFVAMFGGFEMFNRLFASWRGTSWEMSRGMENFIAGGMGSNLYWLMALPMDNVKNRIMVDSLRSSKYTSVSGAYRAVWRETYDASRSVSWNSVARVKNFYRGFVPVALRAFPTNAAALAVWEGIMRWSST